MPAATLNQAPKTIHADPTKDFFVKMITRDIKLEDCISDLLDNAIDGARRQISNDSTELQFSHFHAEIALSREEFSIRDDCGGISLSDAIDYAFHFGRKPNAPSDTAGGIGLYGIGMKRAIFKIGKNAEIVSETANDCFRVLIDVATWESRDDWDFEYQDHTRAGTNGTYIKITSIVPGIDSEFDDAVFVRELMKSIARDYAFFIDKGFSIKVNGEVVPSYHFKLKSGAEIAPAVDAYEDDGVRVRIVAGLVDDLPDDIPEELRPEGADRYGWFVICNQRVVLAADKSERTIWGDDGYRVWHPQYNGFAGFVFFEADDQRKLPWTTTKREVDASNPLFRRTLTKMKQITDEFAAYTNRRKTDIEEAKTKERVAVQVSVQSLASNQAFRLPTFSTRTGTIQFVSICYKRPVKEIDEIKRFLSSPSMSNKDVGVRTFEYYRKMELGK